MLKNYEEFQNPTKTENFGLPKNMELETASNPLQIKEGELASGSHLGVVGLANCLGIGLENEASSFVVAAHIGPFGGERYDAVEQIDAWADGYVSQITQDFRPDQQPSSIVVRSRIIGSRPLFHNRMIEALKRRFPDANINIENGTDFEITV